MDRVFRLVGSQAEGSRRESLRYGPAEGTLPEQVGTVTIELFGND